MKRYDIEPIEASDLLLDIRANEYKYGDWVKYEDANNEIYELQMKLDKLEKIISSAYDILDRGR